MDRPRSSCVLLDEVDHRHRCRRREIELAADVRLRRFFAPPILEIGSGDGFQGELLAERFGRVVATDVDTSRFHSRLPVVRAQGERLPFRDGAFKTIFSSSVLEHVGDLDRGLAEMKRVLHEDGFMVHLVPTRFWLVLMHGLRLPYMFARRAYRAWVKARIGYDDEACGAWWYAGYDIRWDNVFDAPIHGVSPTHREEWRAFAHHCWLRSFRRAALGVVAVEDLYTYSPYGFVGGAEGLRTALARLGFPTVRAYVLRAL